MVKILIDNGHGVNTKGKQSPDGRLREYAFAREIAKRVESCLKCKGYDVERIVPEDFDISLSIRCKRVNDICRKVGAKNVLVVSIHSNAAGCNGKWYSARGFSAHVGLNASANSKKLAACLWDKAIELGLKGNRAVPNDRYIPQDLAICRNTLCPAVLTENLFYDNMEDLELLLSEDGKAAITKLHVDGIIDYINNVAK